MQRKDNETRSKEVIDVQRTILASDVTVVNENGKTIFIDNSVPYTGKTHEIKVRGSIPRPMAAVYDKDAKLTYLNIVAE